MLEHVGLGARRGHRPHQLSGGEQQRVAIARALITEPALLLADEPTGNLDSATGAQVLDLFARLRADLGVTLIMATHDPAIAARAGRELHIVDGRLTDPPAAPALLPDSLAATGGRR
jgi:putative ABC transport system ATP-binding protein